MYWAKILYLTTDMEDKIYRSTYKSPLGFIILEGNTEEIRSLYFSYNNQETEPSGGELAKAVKQLDEYFNGSRKKFNLRLSPVGTDFQKKVWHVLMEISFGSTISYMDLARQLGDEKAIRAVANANAKNPISIFIPCHRVIGSDGSPVGYGGGIWRKRWLLNFEGSDLQLFTDLH